MHVQRKHDDFLLYPETNQDGAVQPDAELSYVLDKIEEAIDKDCIDEFEKGMYTALVDIMGTPLVKLREKFLDILDHINANVDENLEDEDDMHTNLESHTKDTVANLPVIVPPAIPEPDLTDEELEKELEETNRFASGCCEWN